MARTHALQSPSKAHLCAPALAAGVPRRVRGIVACAKGAMRLFVPLVLLACAHAIEDSSSTLDTTWASSPGLFSPEAAPRARAAAASEEDATGDTALNQRLLFERALNDHIEDTSSGSGEETEVGSGDLVDDTGSGSGDAGFSPPPPPPFTPGTTFVTVNATVVVIELQLAGTVDNFDKAAYESKMREILGCQLPDCALEVEIISGSIMVRTTARVKEDSALSNATAVEESARALESKTAEQLDETLGSSFSVEGTATVSVESGVQVTFSSAAPSPPPPSPSPPPAPADPTSPSTPPPSAPPDSDDDGLETWVIAVIAVGAVVGLITIALILYKALGAGGGAGFKDTSVDKPKSGFPSAIGASTTQHV